MLETVHHERTKCVKISSYSSKTLDEKLATKRLKNTQMIIGHDVESRRPRRHSYVGSDLMLKRCEQEKHEDVTESGQSVRENMGILTQS